MTLSYEELVELNKDALEWLKRERPVVHRTLLRWFRGKNYWNKNIDIDNDEANFSLIILRKYNREKYNDEIIIEKGIKEIVISNIDFSNINFPKRTDFHHTIFYGEADFHEATFSGNADFSRGRFSDRVNFLETTFSDKTGKADFHGVTFSGYTSFSGAHFSGDADFHDATFSKEACFENAVFSADANFHEVTFSGNADFRVKIFCGDADFRFSIFEKPVDFSGAQFKKESDFSAMRSEKTFNLRETRFHIVPNFMDATFKILPVLDHIEIDNQLRSKRRLLGFWFNSLPDCSKRLSRDISRRFRILGRRAHETRDWLHEMEFFAQEIRTRRFGLDFPLGEWRGLRKGLAWVVRKSRLKPMRQAALKFAQDIKDSPLCGPHVGRFWFGWFYELLSNFGRSFARPFFAWLASVGVFAFLYLGFAKAGGLGDALAFSFRHGTIVSGLVRSPHYQQLLCNLFARDGKVGTCLDKPVALLEMSNGLYAFTILQTVVSAFFLFLFFLAVRNHFRIR